MNVANLSSLQNSAKTQTVYHHHGETCIWVTWYCMPLKGLLINLLWYWLTLGLSQSWREELKVLLLIEVPSEIPCDVQCSSDISELCIRVLYTHILRIHVCQYTHMFAYIHAHMRVYTRVYGSLLRIPISFFIWSIVCQRKDIYGNKEASLICIWLKCLADQWKLLRNVHFSVKRSEDPCRKNIISRSIWPKSFIQTVKYSTAQM